MALNNYSVSLCCEHCGRTDIVELQTTFGIVLCPLCRAQFKNDLDRLVRKYKEVIGNHGQCFNCKHKTDTCQEGLHCIRDYEEN